MQTELDAVKAENERLRVALRFYARSEHYSLDDDEDFDSVSGEPENCRLVSVAANYAMNAWGEEILTKISIAHLKNRRLNLRQCLSNSEKKPES